MGFYIKDTQRMMTASWIYDNHFDFNINDAVAVKLGEHGIYSAVYQNKQWVFTDIEQVNATDDKFWSDTPNAKVFKVTGHTKAGRYPCIYNTTKEERKDIIDNLIKTQEFYVAHDDDVFDKNKTVLATGKDASWVLRNLRRKQRKEMYDVLGV